MPRLGYLLPTRESVMEGRDATGPLLALAERAEALGYDSIWIGDSLLARPRHDPLTLMAAVAARTKKPEIGTAVLLPTLRNPVVLAQQVATVDRLAEGRIILGVGIASDLPNIRHEFEAAGVPFDKRVGRFNEGLRLCKALWSGKPVDWDGRWKMKGAVLGPTPHRPGGPPLWIPGSVPAARERAGKFYDGWFPNGPRPDNYAQGFQEVKAAAKAAGRDPGKITGAMYVTLAIEDDAAKANARMDKYCEAYYGQPAAVIRKMQSTFAGPKAEAAKWLKGFVDAGATHICIRLAGDHERQLEIISGIRRDLGW